MSPESYPTDADFGVTSSSATVHTEGQVVTVNFAGSWFRTSTIEGSVTADDDGLNGVSVTISGIVESETVTDGNGRYSFSNLRAGDYAVQILGFDTREIEVTTKSVSVRLRETADVSFQGKKP